MTRLSASELRKIAMYLEQLAGEDVRGISTVGHSGYSEITLQAAEGPDIVLRIVRINEPAEDGEEIGPIGYALEIEG